MSSSETPNGIVIEEEKKDNFYNKEECDVLAEIEEILLN